MKSVIIFLENIKATAHQKHEDSIRVSQTILPASRNCDSVVVGRRGRGGKSACRSGGFRSWVSGLDAIREGAQPSPAGNELLSLLGKGIPEGARRGLVLASALIFSAALAACGGGGGGAAGTTPTATVTAPAVAASAPATVSPSAKVVSVSAQGDSTMKGYTFVNGAYIVSPNNAPAVLQQLLQATYGPTVTVENDGVIGATLGERINGYVLYSEAFSTALQSMTAQIVIENFAANDVYSNNQETPTSFEGYLLDFVTEAQAAGKTVVLEEPNPFTAPEYANMPQYVAIIDNVAAQLNLPLVKQYDYIQTLPNWQSLLSDGGHPTDALYAIKAQREYDVVAPIVSSMMQP